LQYDEIKYFEIGPADVIYLSDNEINLKVLPLGTSLYSILIKSLASSSNHSSKD
jgi:hypothetical protein